MNLSSDVNELRQLEVSALAEEILEETAILHQLGDDVDRLFLVTTLSYFFYLFVNDAEAK